MNVTDGRYVYMRAPVAPGNGPLNEYTLMPVHMRAMASPGELWGAELVEGFSFIKGCPVLKFPSSGMGNPWSHGTLLFDLETDPGQKNPIHDDALEMRMATRLVDLMRANDAPTEQFERLGLPATGDIGPEHLLVAAMQAGADEAKLAELEHQLQFMSQG